MGNVCGEEIDILWDKKVNKLNLELHITKDGCPQIKFQDWTKEGESKDILTIHLREAIKLKSIIDGLVLDYNEERIDEIGEKLKK